MLLACIGFEASGLVKDGQITDVIQGSAWPVWLSLAGLMLIGTLSHYNVKGGILIGVVLCAVTYWYVTGTFPAKVKIRPISPCSPPQHTAPLSPFFPSSTKRWRGH